MGFEVHITRGGDPLEDMEPTPISIEEWHVVVNGDPELEFDPTSERPGYALWKRPDEPPVVFEFRHSHVSITDPDEETLAKAAAVAKALGAEVHGEDGEEYDDEGHLQYDPDDDSTVREQLETQSQILDEMRGEAEEEDLAAIKRPWWKRILK